MLCACALLMVGTAGTIVWFNTLEVLLRWFASPLYVAVTLSLPTGSELMLGVRLATPPAPIGMVKLPPSVEKVIVPVASLGLTVALKVTGNPCCEGLAEEVSVTAVLVGWTWVS